MTGVHTWVFARHGRSEANEGGWLSGHRDVALVARGREEAVALGGDVAAFPVDDAWSSDLARAVETRDLALRAAGLRVPVHADPRLRERDCGAWTGERFDQIPGVQAVLYGWFERPPGGESLADVAVRATAALSEVERPGGVTFVVAHGGTLRALLGLADGLPIAGRTARMVDNARAHPVRLPVGTWSRLHAQATSERDHR